MVTVYIVGRGHSGTTVIDLVLGHALQFRSCGELVSGLSRYPEQLCSCGKRMAVCQLWSGALSLIGDVKDVKSFSQKAASRASVFELFKLPLRIKNEGFRQDLAEERLFLERLEGSFNGVIDSSKELGRGVQLAVGPTKAYWLHVYRDPVQIALSYRYRATLGRQIKIYRKLYRVPALFLWLLDVFVALSWSLWTLATIVFGVLFVDRYICLKYEHFVADPLTHLGKIAVMLKVPFDYERVRELVESEMSVGHIVGGNRMGEKGSFSIKNRAKTDRKIPLVTRLICCIFCSPVLAFANLMHRKSFSNKIDERIGV